MLAFLRGNPRFLRYWISTWFSEGSDWVRNSVMLFVVMDLTQGSATAVSLNLFCEFGPLFLFGFLVGAYADRWDRKRTILGSVVFRLVVTLLSVLAVLMKSLWLIYVASFFSAFGTLFFRASAPAFSRLFIPQEDRKYSVALRQMSISTMLMIGSPVGTLLYLSIGAMPAFLLCIALYFCSLALVASVQVPRTGGGEAEKGLSGVWQDMKEGFRYAFGHEKLRPVLLANVLFGLGAGMINVLEVFVVTEFLGLPKEMMSVLVVVQSIGSILGAPFIGKLRVSVEQLVSYGMMLAGIGLAGMVLYPSVVVTSVALFVFSIGQAALNIGMATLQQTQVAFEYQGRTGMTVQTIFNGLMVVALLSTGSLHDAFSVQPVVMSGGLLTLAGGIICQVMFARLMKQSKNWNADL